MNEPATPAEVGSSAELGLEPAAHVRWHEQNGWDVTEFSGLREHPEIKAFWGNRRQLALYTADQVRAAVAAERERLAQRCEQVAAHELEAMTPKDVALYLAGVCRA